MSKTGLQTANQQRNLAHWRKQIADCRSSGQTIAQWCSVHGIPKSTYYTWQRKLYEVTVSASDTFVEVPLAPQPISRISVATVSMSGVTAEIYNGADEATLAALFRAMKSC